MATDPWAQFKDVSSEPSDADPWAQFKDVQDAPAAAPEPMDTRPTGDLLDAAIEPVMSLGSGAVAMPVAGLAGLGTAAARGLGLTDAFPGDVVTRVQESLTFQPRTKAGGLVSGAIAYPFEKLAQGANYVGEKTADATGSPALGAAANTAIQTVPALFLRRGKAATVKPDGPAVPASAEPAVATGESASKAAAAVPEQRPPRLGAVPEEPIPTRAELRQLADDAYKRADEAGVVVTRNSLNGLKTRLVSMAKKEGIDKDLHPDSSATLKKIVQSKGQLKLGEVETLRKVAKDAQGALKPADKRIASKIVDEIDDYLDNLSDADVIAGDANATKALKEARGYYSRAKKSEMIEELVQRAELSAPNFSASGLENALRTEFRNLAKNPRKMRLLTAEEQAAIRKVAQGGKMENAMRFIGKFAPTGVVSGVLSGGAGAMIGGPLGAALPLSGMAGRAIATRMTKRNVRNADELMRRGPAGANALATKQAEKKRNALADF